MGKTKKVAIWLIIVCIIIILFFSFLIINSVFANNEMKQIDKSIKNKDFIRAKTLLDKNLEEQPNNEKLYLLYVDYYLAKDEYVNALNILNKGEKKLPKEKRIRNRIQEIKQKYANEIDLETRNNEQQELQLEDSEQEGIKIQNQHQEGLRTNRDENENIDVLIE